MLTFVKLLHLAYAILSCSAWLVHKACAVQLRAVQHMLSVNSLALLETSKQLAHTCSILKALHAGLIPILIDCASQCKACTSALMLCSESAHVHVDHKLPFELRALEAALASALHAMEDDARMLTEHIQPILEGLTREVKIH